MPPRFDWLAPSALAVILKDCRVFVDMLQGDYNDDALRVMGGAFWRARQGDVEAFKFTRLNLPALRERAALFDVLIISLGDDGLIYLKADDA